MAEDPPRVKKRSHCKPSSLIYRFDRVVTLFISQERRSDATIDILDIVEMRFDIFDSRVK